MVIRSNTDKIRKLRRNLAELLVAQAGLPTARFVKVAPGEELPAELSGLEFPLFVKPNAEGSSKGIRYSSKVTDRAGLEAMVRWVHDTYDQPALVEEYLPGREFSVGLLGNGPRLRTLPVVGVRPGRAVPAVALGDDPTSEFIYSYEAKSANMEEAECPADIPEALAAHLADLARRVWRVFECRDVARVDFKLDRAGTPHFLEVNPLPSLSREWSFLALEARAAGMDYQELILTILDEALIRCGFAREASDGRWAPWRAESLMRRRIAGTGS